MNTDYIWYQQYPKKVSKTIQTDTHQSLVEIFEEKVKEYASNPAFSNMEVDMTYGKLDELSKNFAAYLQSIGLQKGDKLGIQMPNLLQYPVVVFGALRAGLTVVNVNPLYTPREMSHQYRDSGVKAIVILANFAYNLEKIINEVKPKHVIITEIGDLLGGLKGGVVNFVVKKIKKMVPAFSLPQAVKFKTAMKQGAKASFKKVNLTPDDVAFLQYTGGTTGVSKGATLTHRNMVANVIQGSEWFKGTKEHVHLEAGKEVMITALPLYHIFALLCNCLLTLNLGCKSVLVTNPRDMPAFLKTLRKNPFSMITGVNTLFNGLLNQETFKDLDFSKLKMAFAGGMAAQKVVIEKWKATTGVTITEGYGLSETSPILTGNPLDGRIKIGAIGLPIPNTELAIMDEEGNPLPANEVGEICAKGPQVMVGYWQRPEETAKVFNKEGWFRTGDIGKMDEEGYFYIVDRKKDMILVSGFNVYPNEVEDVVASHEKILEVAAIGVPDDKATERVKVFVVKKDSSLTEEEVIAYCKENMAGYKVPKYVQFKEELPKSNVGKILRRVLKEEEEKAKATTS